MTEKIKIKFESRKLILIHNEISAAALYFKNRVLKLANDGVRDGIGFEKMACVVMLAFATEARVNFFGHKLIENWDERKPYNEKVKMVAKNLGLTPDFTKRPYKTVSELKDLRDIFAHGKPIEDHQTIEIITTHRELETEGYLLSDWQKLLTDEFVKRAFDDSESIWKDLLTRSRLEVYDTLTRGERSVTFIEKISEVGKQ